MVGIKHESMRKGQTSHKKEHNTRMCFPLKPVFTRDKGELPNFIDEPAAGLDVIVREEFYKLIIDEQQENGRTFIISTHIIEEAANVFEEVIILKDKCVYLKENTVELLDKCRYVSGLEEDVKNAVDGCKIINEEHIGRSYAVTVMQDGDGKIKAVQHVTVQPVSLQNLFIAICGQSNM